MADGFSLYDLRVTGNGLPLAAKEHAFSIAAHKQQTLLTTNKEEILFTINGYLSEEFSYSSQAQYDNITTPQAPDNLLWKVFKDESQRSLATYGWLTKKTYSNSSSQALTIKFRAVVHGNFNTCYATGGSSGETINNPVHIAELLMSLTMNTVGKNAFFNFTSLGKTEIGKKVKHYVAEGVGLAADAANVIASPIGLKFDRPAPQPDGNVGKSTSDAISNPIDTAFVKNPLVVRLNIGNIFEKDYMVVKNVDVTFSKEYFDEGVPLYADYTVTLESLFNSSNQENPEQKMYFGSGLVTNKPKYQIEIH